MWENFRELNNQRELGKSVLEPLTSELGDEMETALLTDALSLSPVTGIPQPTCPS